MNDNKLGSQQISEKLVSGSSGGIRHVITPEEVKQAIKYIEDFRDNDLKNAMQSITDDIESMPWKDENYVAYKSRYNSDVLPVYDNLVLAINSYATFLDGVCAEYQKLIANANAAIGGNG